VVKDLSYSLFKGNTSQIIFSYALIGKSAERIKDFGSAAESYFDLVATELHSKVSCLPLVSFHESHLPSRIFGGISTSAIQQTMS
jgi:hypothetical protein